MRHYPTGIPSFEGQAVRKNVDNPKLKLTRADKINDKNTVYVVEDALSGKVVGGFLVFGSPIKPKHVSRAKIAAAIARLG